MTVCDLRNLRRDGSVSIGAPPKPNAKVAVACDARSLIDDVISTLLTYR